MIIDPRVVGVRCDAAVVAFRVTLADDVKRAFQDRHDVAKEHGRAQIAVGDLRGELKFSRTGTFNVTNRDLRARVDLKAPGAVDLPDGTREAGWTLEIVFAAQALAALPTTSYQHAIDVAVAQATRIAESLGMVYEARLRRMDLCADVANWQVDPEERERLVKRPHAKMSTHPQIDVEDKWAPATIHERQRVTGFTVCPGGAMLARIYDKREEIGRAPEAGSRKKEDPEKRVRREAEEARWRASGGWDGDAPVTRVEFQIRGEAIRDLGLRNPTAPEDPQTGRTFARLGEVLDRVWQRCIQWVRLIVRDNERRTRCSNDPRWEILKGVTFLRPTSAMHGRRRVRGGASTEQTLGCVLSVLGARSRLQTYDEEVIMASEEIVVSALSQEVRLLFAEAGGFVLERMLDKWGGGRRAAQHLAIIVNATRARFVEGAPNVESLGRAPVEWVAA